MLVRKSLIVLAALTLVGSASAVGFCGKDAVLNITNMSSTAMYAFAVDSKGNATGKGVVVPAVKGENYGSAVVRGSKNCMVWLSSNPNKAVSTSSEYCTNMVKYNHVTVNQYGDGYLLVISSNPKTCS